MALRKTALYDRIYGCLLGAAIGDAFGMRAEMMHYRDIAAQYGRVEHFDPLPPRQPSRQPPREIWNSFGQETGHAEGFDPLGRWSNSVNSAA